MTVRGITDIDREHYVWGRMTKRQLLAALPFGIAALVFFVSGAVMRVQTPDSGNVLGALGIVCTVLASTIAYVPSPKGKVAGIRRNHFGPHTLVNGSVDTLPPELRYPGWRKDRKRVAQLSAPFAGFDAQGCYAIAGGVTRVLTVSPVDDELLSEKERASYGARFVRLLNSLPSHIIATITGEPVSFDTEAERIRNRPQPTGGLSDYARDHAAFLADKRGSRRQVYLSIHGPDAQTADLRAEDITDQLKRMNRVVHWLTPSESASLTARISGGDVPYRHFPSEPVVRGA